MPLFQTSWHVHSQMNAFTQICIECNPNWIARVHDILNNLSPVVTFSHIMHFRIYTMHQSMRKLTQMILPSHCSWRIHSHMNAFTQTCNESNPNGIVTVYDILNNLPPVVTFSHMMHFMTYTMHQSIQNLIQIIPPSRTSWHFHSHMNAFTQICITCNPNRIVTVCDILNNLSPAATFSHVFQDLYNASVHAKTNSDHSPISLQLAHSFTHECIHANKHYMQSQLNCQSQWYFK